MGSQMEPWVLWLKLQGYKVDLVNRGEHDHNMTRTVVKSLRNMLGAHLHNKALFLPSVANDKASEFDINDNGESPGANTALSTTKGSGVEAVSLQDDIKYELESNRSAVFDENFVFGSPLKLNKIADLTSISSDIPLDDIEFSSGLDISQQIPLPQARKILQKFNQDSKSTATEAMVAVICNAEDVKKTLLIGAHKEIAQDSFKLESFVLTMKIVDLSPLEDSQPVINGQRYQMAANYELLNPSLGLGSLAVKAKWSDPKGRLKISEPLSTEFSFEWNIAIGSEQSPVYLFNRELQKVSAFMEALKEEMMMDHIFQQELDSDESATERLKKLFDRHKADLLVAERLNQDDGFPGLTGGLVGVAGTNKLNLSPPTEADFTDELWDILGGCCTSLQELVLCMKETFTKLHKGHYHMFVGSDNRSTVANLARAAASGLAVFPPLTGRLALTLTLQIGIERLRKLYHSVMVTTNNLCSPTQWDDIFKKATYLQTGAAAEEDDNAEVAMFTAQLAALRRLHGCLESVAIIDTFSESQDLPKIARVILSDRSSNRNSSHRHLANSSVGGSEAGSGFFKIPISAAQAMPELKKHKWTSMRREHVRGGNVTVETFLHHMPSGLLDKPSCEDGNVWRFTAHHNRLWLGSC